MTTTNPFTEIEKELAAIKSLLRSLAERTNESDKIQFYTRAETADLLHLTYPTLDSYTRKGLIRSSRVGRRILYSAEAIKEAVRVIQESEE